MYKKTTCLAVLFFLFSFVNVSFAGYHIKKSIETPVITRSAENETPTISKPAEQHAHLSFFQRAKLKVVTKLMEHYHNGHHSDRSDLSILSFCLSMGSYAVLAVSLVLLFASVDIAGAIALALCGLMSIAGFVLGIVALSKRQRLKGLAIAGIILGAQIAVYFVIGLLLLLAGTAF